MLKPLDHKMSDSEKVQVIVRVRPLSEKESESQEQAVVEMDLKQNEIHVKKVASASGIFGNSSSETEVKPFTFDGVFDNSFQQKQIYDNVFHSLVDSVLQGFNGTIFAYGQTGTGKTYAMEGSWESENLYGVMPNSFRHIFDHISANSDKRYLIRASYLEIYQEDVRDLLCNTKLKKCEIREGANGVYIKDLSSYLCSNFKEIADLMTKGTKNRAVGATNMNEHSSRSHSIFQITVETSEQSDEDGEHIRVGKLNLVDLAGSERASKTGAQGERFKEATKINLSLSSLGNVISALVDGAAYIPYRDSKLTRLLQDSLGGNSRTVMIATIGPAASNYDETMNTLRYASRAKNIKNKPRINENPKDAVLRHYQEEINRLKNLVFEKKAQRRLSNFDEASRDPMQSNAMDKSISADSSQKISQIPNPIEFMKESRVQQLTKLLQPYGIKFEGDLCDIMDQLQDRKSSLMKNTQMVKEDKEKLLNKLQHATTEIQSAETECSQLEDQIEWLESKVLNSSGIGTPNLIQKVKNQRKEIQMNEKELEQQRSKEEELRKALAEKQMSFEETLSTLSSAEQEFGFKVEKIAKIKRKTKGLRKESIAIQRQHRDNIKKVEICIQEISKELKLKKTIIDNFVPRAFMRDFEKRIRYDDVEDTYFVTPPIQNWLEPIPVDRMVPFPMYNMTRFQRLAPKENMFFSNQNLLLPQPLLPKWKSKLYVPDKKNPKMELLVKEAAKDIQKPLVINCDHRIKRKIVKTEPPMYTAVGPSILLKRIPAEKYVDFAFVPPDVTLPRGSNISIVDIPQQPSQIRKLTQEELLALPLVTLLGDIFHKPDNSKPAEPRKVVQINATEGTRNPHFQSRTPSVPMNYICQDDIPQFSRPTSFHSPVMRDQKRIDFKSATNFDREIEEIERELMDDGLKNNFSNQSFNSKIQLSCFKDDFEVKQHKTTPTTRGIESRKGHVKSKRRDDFAQHKDFLTNSEKQTMEHEIIRRLKTVGLRSPPENDGPQSLGDYIREGSETSPHFQILLGKAQQPHPDRSTFSSASTSAMKTDLRTHQTEVQTSVERDTDASEDPRKLWNYSSVKTKSQEGKTSLVVSSKSSDSFSSEESSEPLKTTSKTKTPIEALTLQDQRAQISKNLLPFVEDFKRQDNEISAGSISSSSIRFPTFRTSNDIGTFTTNKSKLKEDSDEESEDDDQDDELLSEVEPDFSDSDLSSSSDEDNHIPNETTKSKNIGYNTGGSDAEDTVAPDWQAEYSDRPPTRPCSQRMNSQSRN